MMTCAREAFSALINISGCTDFLVELIKNSNIGFLLATLHPLPALTYGLYAVADGRPAWLVFASDSFEMMCVPDIDDRPLAQAAITYSTASWFGSKWVAANFPFLADEKNQILFESMAGGPNIAQRLNLYQPLDRQSNAIRQQAQSLSALAAFNPEEQIQQISNHYTAANGWLPLKVNAGVMTVLVNMDTGAVVSIIDLRPWD